MTPEQIDNLFKEHLPKNARQQERKQEIRAAANDFAQLIGRLTPNSGERTLALRNVQQSMLMAFEAINCNE